MNDCEDCRKTMYCEECGSILILNTKVYRPYDRVTGKLVNKHWRYWRCPHYRNIFSKHSSFNDEPLAMTV